MADQPAAPAGQHTDLMPAGTRDVAESDTELVDGEFVDEPVPGGRRPARRATAPSARKYPRARGTGLFLLRHAILIGQGHHSWGRRIHAALTYGHVREQIHRARAAGDAEQLAAWIDRHNQLRHARHERIRRLPQTIVAAGRVLLVAVATGGGVLLLVGVLFKVGLGRPGWRLWWQMVGATGHVISVAVSVAATLVIYGGVPMLLLAAWIEGRRHGKPLTWAVSSKQRAVENAIVTPAGIAEALAHLNLAPLNQAIKKGWTVRFVVPPVRVNDRGYQAVFDLPMGVTVDMIADKREVLARNLSRSTIEVWPTEGEHNGIVDLWVANPGSSRRPAPPYPLLTAGTCDVFTGVPLGVSQRGDVIAPPLFEANMVFGGLPGQGKSNAVRVVMLGAALDPLAELWVFVFAGNGDFDAYQPRLARYHRGTRPEVAEAALAALHELYAEVGRREERLAELGAKKLSRALAEKHPDLRPIVAGFSECHELFGHPEYGKEAGEVAVNIVKRGRKTGVITAYDTQSSRAAAIPPALVENVAINTCFYVKTWRNNDGFLGDGSFQAGIRATELRFNVDRGTSVTTGASDETFELMRWYYIEADDTGFDAATDVIARAMAGVHPAVAVGGQGSVLAPTRRDLVTDLAAVLGAERVTAPDAAALLRDLAPDWAAYRGLNGVGLRALLEAEGIKVPTTGNKLWVDPTAVRRVLAAREIEGGEG